jgi:hypothetical protein
MKKLFPFFVFGALVISTFQISIAQNSDGTDSGENIFLPQATGYSNTGYETNIYLQQDAAAKESTNGQTPAQKANGKLAGVYTGTTLSCPYSFERDLQVGSKGEDVRLLQVLLNSDRRTLIAVDGPGSQGKETTNFGDATKVAVKKFQALFIEYIGIANGRFGPRTRTVMNAICNGQTPGTTASGRGAAYDNVTSVQKDATPQGEITEIPNDKISPRASLSANVNAVDIGSSFKVVGNFSEEIKAFTPDSVIVDGGVVKEIRKLSKASYSMTITPNDDTKSVTVQIEAEKVMDLAGNPNENASNEITVKVRTAIASNNSDSASMDGLVNKIVSSAPQCNYDNNGQLITINPTTGQQVNASGCSPTKQTYASYNSSLNCYGDNGLLPSGVSEMQRCSNPNNPNNPNSACNATAQQQFLSQQQQAQSYYGYTPYMQNPCQNPNVVAATQQQAQQQAAQRAQAAQQAQMNQGLGQMLGNLLGKMGGGMFGNKGGDRNGNGGDTSRGPSGPGTTPGPGTQTSCEGIPNATDKANCEKQIALRDASIDCNDAANAKAAKCVAEDKANSELQQKILNDCKTDAAYPNTDAGLEQCLKDKISPASTPEKTNNENSKEVDVVIERLDKCSTLEEYFCTSGLKRSSYLGPAFIMKKGDKKYLLVSSHPKLLKLKKDQCIVETPNLSPQYYTKYEFIGCSSRKFTNLGVVCTAGTVSEKPKKLKDIIDMYDYTHTDDIESAGANACKPK